MSDGRADTVNLAQVPRAAAANRLNRPPNTARCRKMAWLLGFVFFFDMDAIHSLSSAAPVIMKSGRLRSP